jgi:transposase
MPRVFQGSTDASLFEGFLEQLLHCGKWPEPKSVLIMDNASFLNTERIAELCSNAGVRLLYLSLYSPDLNPIEEFFAELKAFVRRNWQKHTGEDFKDFLEWSLDVGARVESVQGHFKDGKTFKQPLWRSLSMEKRITYTKSLYEAKPNLIE